MLTKRRRRKFRGLSNRKRIRRIWTYMRNKGLRNIETKYVTGNFDSGGSAAGANRITTLQNQTSIERKITFSDPIPEGSSRLTRVGSKIFIKSLKLRFYIEAPDATTPETFVPSENYIRIIIVREKEGLGSSNINVLPTVRHVFQNNLVADSDDPTTVEANDSRAQFIAMYYRYYKNKFADNYTVLHDRTYKVANQQGAERYYRLAKRIIKVNQPCTWDDANNRGDGHLYMFAFTDITSTPETDNAIPRLFCSWRMTFTDV